MQKSNLDQLKRFPEQVYQIVKKIPSGKVLTYGQIAQLLGKPGASRAVGNALHHNPDPGQVPCHRVVTAQGKLAENFGFGGSQEQKKRLRQEQVEFSGENQVNLKKHQLQLSITQNY